MLYYLEGDATQPECAGNKIIAHICNDVGGWGRGFVVAVSKRWKLPETAYRLWASQKYPGFTPLFVLGQIQLVQVAPDITVANMIAQHDIEPDEEGNPPIRYEALRECLVAVFKAAEEQPAATIHMPRIGCGLAGGSWTVIEKIIHELRNDIDVYVYDLPNNPIPWKK